MAALAVYPQGRYFAKRVMCRKCDVVDTVSFASSAGFSTHVASSHFVIIYTSVVTKIKLISCNVAATCVCADMR